MGVRRGDLGGGGADASESPGGDPDAARVFYRYII
jgi:hypothetical protein